MVNKESENSGYQIKIAAAGVAGYSVYVSTVVIQ